MAIRKKHPSYTGKAKKAIEHNGFYPFFKHYMSHLEVIGQTPRTRQTTDSAIRTFISWCDQRELHDPSDVTPSMIERYQRHLFYYRKANGKPLAFNSQRSMLGPIRGLFKWLTKTGAIKENPTLDMQMVRKPQRLPRVILSPEQIKSIFNQPDVSTPEGVRDRAILETFYSTGIRRSELCALEVQDVHMNKGVILIREGKGAKDRYVPVDQQASRWISKYHTEIRPLFASEQEHAFYLTGYGKPFGQSDLGNRIKKYMQQAGVDVEGCCHLFRHAVATHMLENGADVRYIQALLGHSNINTTTIYTQVTMEKLKQVHASTHPNERVGMG